MIADALVLTALRCNASAPVDSRCWRYLPCEAHWYWLAGHAMYAATFPQCDVLY
ncbi:MAG: hypothetical protein ABIP64_07200 [Burkholderiales bacterium]